MEADDAIFATWFETQLSFARPFCVRDKITHNPTVPIYCPSANWRPEHDARNVDWRLPMWRGSVPPAQAAE